MTRRLRPFSLVNRVRLGTLAAVLVVVGGTSFYLDKALVQLFQREGNRELVEKAALMAERLEDTDWDAMEPEMPEAPDEPAEDGTPAKPPAKPTPKPPPTLDRSLLVDTENCLVRVVDWQDRVLLESEGMGRLLPQNRIPPRDDWTWQDVEGPTGARFLVHAQGFSHGLIYTAWDIRHEHTLLRKSRDLLIATWGLAALAAALLASGLVRRGLRPLETLADKAEGIRPGALRLDLDPGTLPRELEPLATRLQGALARLEEAFGRLTSLNADVAHELRTPLHGIRLEVEGLLGAGRPPADQEETLEGLLETLDHLSATLDQMLFLARAEDPAMALQPTDLAVADLLTAAAGPFEPLAEEKDVILRIQCPEGLRLQADPILARRALHNLLANAIRHTREGSTVSLEALREGGSVILQVRDEGEGIPADFLERIGQRFLRPDASRSRASGGAGLGLAIVASILRLHGGRLSFESEPGRGTLARLHFPA